MSGACLPNEKSSARSYNYSFRPIARNIGIFACPCSTVVEQHDSNRSTLTSAKPAWSKMVPTREISKPSHLSACSYGETRNCDVEDQTERVFRQGLAREPCP